MDNEYYILEGSELIGPFTLRNLLARPLEPSDVVVLPNDTLGRPAYEISEFDEYFHSEGIYYPTPKNTSSFWLRLPAFIIDYFIVVIGIMILGVIFFPQYIMSFQPDVAPGTSLSFQQLMQASTDNAIKHQTQFTILKIVVSLITILYNAACESSKLRGSLGKYAMGLTVVDDMGYGLTFGQALKRNAFKLFYEVLSFINGIGPFAYLFYLRIIWGERHQAIHDKFSGCYVVKKNA